MANEVIDCIDMVGLKKYKGATSSYHPRMLFKLS